MTNTFEIPSTIPIGFNYQLTKATPEVLARIACEMLGLPVTGSEWQQFINKAKTGIVEEIQPRLLMFLRNYNGLLVPEIEVERKHNVVPKVLRRSMAQRNAGTVVSPTFECNRIVLGSGTNLVNENDTQLQTETLRAAFTNRYAVDVTAYLDKFFDTSEVGGNTYNEAGIVVDGTDTINSGYLFSHVNISQAIGANQTLSINGSVTYTSL